MFIIPEYHLLVNAIANDQSFINKIKNVVGATGKFLGSFYDSIDKVIDSDIIKDAQNGDYIFILFKDTRTTFIFNGIEWVKGYTVNVDYLDPSDFCIIIPNSPGTLSSQELAKFKNNLKAIKIYNEYEKAFYHSAYEDNAKYYFYYCEYETSQQQSLYVNIVRIYVLSIDKETGAYQTTIKYINLKPFEDGISENVNNINSTRQVIVANLGGNSGNFDASQIKQLLNFVSKGDDSGEGEQYKKLINPLFVKLWDNSSGLIYQLTSKPINNNFGNWIFTNQQIAGGTLNATLTVQKIIVSVVDENNATWTKVTKSIN